MEDLINKNKVKNQNKNQNNILTIAICAYNEENNIEKTINSLEKQINQNFKILVVNDGSTDNTLNILKSYQKRYGEEKFKIIDKENEGVSESRNIAVKNIETKYFSFLDGDDYLREDFTQLVLKELEENENTEEIDVLKYGFYIEDINSNILSKTIELKYLNISGKDFFFKHWSEDPYLVSMCLYVFKTDFFKENNFKFVEGRKHEDFYLIPFILIKSNKIKVIPDHIYIYVNQEESIMTSVNALSRKKNFDDLIFYYLNLEKEIQKYGIVLDLKDKKKLDMFYANSLLTSASNLKNIDEKIYLEIIIKLKEMQIYKKVHPINFKQFIKRLMIKFNLKEYLDNRN